MRNAFVSAEKLLILYCELILFIIKSLNDLEKEAQVHSNCLKVWHMSLIASCGVGLQLLRTLVLVKYEVTINTRCKVLFAQKWFQRKLEALFLNTPKHSKHFEGDHGQATLEIGRKRLKYSRLCPIQQPSCSNRTNTKGQIWFSRYDSATVIFRSLCHGGKKISGVELGPRVPHLAMPLSRIVELEQPKAAGQKRKMAYCLFVAILQFQFYFFLRMSHIKKNNAMRNGHAFHDNSASI